jgi:polar amino acid transport system substrate-binding protein
MGMHAFAKSAKYEKPPVWFLIVLVGFPQLCETIFTPSLPAISQALVTTEPLAQFTLTIFFIGFALGVLVFGYLSDRLGRRIAMLMGLALYTLGSLLCFLSPGIEWLLASRFLQAFGASCGSVVTQTILRDCYQVPAERSRVFATIASVLAVSPAVGPFLGGFLETFWGFRAVFFSLVGIGAVLWIHSYLRLGETRSVNWVYTPFPQVFSRMMRDGKIWSVAFLVAGINAFVFGSYGEAPFLFTGYFHMSTLAYGCVGCLMASCSFAGSSFVKRGSEGNHPWRLIFFGCLLLLLFSWMFLAGRWLGVEGWNQVEQLVYMLTFISGYFFAAGFTIPNCLSEALGDYETCLGQAGAVLGAMYYLMLSVLLGVLNLLHSDSIWTLAMFGSGLSLLMVLISGDLQRRVPAAVER